MSLHEFESENTKLEYAATTNRRSLFVFARCPPKVSSLPSRLSTVIGAMTLRLPRLIFLFVSAIKTLKDVATYMSVEDTRVDNRRSHLWRHVKADHNNRRFDCPQCPNTYVSKGGLNRHVNLIHKKLSRYRCETCGKGFMVRSRYLDHIDTHAGVQRHACPICHMYFTHKGSLKRHVLRVHPNEAAASNTR